MMIVPGLLSESSLNLTELYKSPTQFLDHYVVKTSPSVTIFPLRMLSSFLFFPQQAIESARMCSAPRSRKLTLKNCNPQDTNLFKKSGGGRFWVGHHGSRPFLSIHSSNSVRFIICLVLQRPSRYLTRWICLQYMFITVLKSGPWYKAYKIAM